MSSIEPHQTPLKTIQKIDELLELQQFALENIQEAIFLVDSDAHITYINKAASIHLGYSEDELLSMSVLDLDPLFTHDIWVSHWRDLMEHKSILIETQQRTKKGKIIPVEVRANYFEYNGVGYNMALVHDISERKRIEEELQRQEQHQRMLLDNSPYFVWLKDKESRLLAANNQYARVAKVESTHDLVGKTDYDFFPHDLAEKYVTDDRAVMASGVSKNVEEMYVDENGERHWMETWKSPLIVNGEIVGTVGCSRDITERKNHQELLHDNEQKFLKVFMNSPIALAINDLETSRYIDVNDSFLTYTGYKREEVINHNAFDGINIWCDLADRETFFTTLQKDGVVKDFDFCYKRKDGSTGYASVSATLVSINGRACVVSQNNEITERKIQEALLHQKEQKFRSLAENAKDPIYRYDRNCRRTYVNPAVERLSGKPASMLIGKTPSEAMLVPSEDVLKVMQSLEKVLRSGEPDEIEVKFVNDEGNEYYFQHSHVPEFDMDGNIEGILAIGRDITVQKQLQKDLNAREEMFRTLAENSPNIIMRYDLECHRIYANPAYSEQTGIPLDLAINATPKSQWETYINMISMSAQEYQERIKSVIATGVDDHFSVEWYRLNDGGHVVHDLHLVAERNEKGKIVGALAIGHNITKRSLIEKQIEHMAHHDALTGLPNRILAQDRMEHAITCGKRNNTQAALLFIDLDGFKTINDSLGHSIGDTVLKSVASRLKECVRESDTLSRQGGDEFLLILSEINDHEDVIAIADKLIHAFEQPFSIDNEFLSISASIGIALYPEHGESFESLLQNADAAMYKAKESGKNTYRFFARQMSYSILGAFRIQNDLRNALQNNEFVLHYQPQIDLKANRIIGVEALIRWNHPIQGLIAPMRFIPIAEESGLIVPIGQWVIEESCRQAALWHTQGIKISIAINISAVQFKRGNLEAVVKHALSDSKLDPKYLELELTESIMMHNVESTLQTVQSLKALGVQLSIDDFGTGYSSLSYLKRFAVDKLKIDQSFVRDIVQDQEDAVIVKTIIQMAKNLNLTTIAEGVENQEVLSIIENFGCDEVQGYHFAKPLEATSFERYFASYPLSTANAPL